MASGVISKFSSVAGLAMLASLPAATAEAQGNPTDVVFKGMFGVVTQRDANDRDPNGPEFVVRYSTMHVGDMTFDGGDALQGRAIDCDDLVAGADANGNLEWKLTGRFLARAADLADGSSFDGAFDQEKSAVVSPTFIKSYLSHINAAHHPQDEVLAVAGYCESRYGPSND